MSLWKRYIIPIIFNHRSSRRFNKIILEKALDKLDDEELESLHAILKDLHEENQRLKKRSPHP
jgi:hypothetical protein